VKRVSQALPKSLSGRRQILGSIIKICPELYIMQTSSGYRKEAWNKLSESTKLAIILLKGVMDFT
jgi:hypothetical protein